MKSKRGSPADLEKSKPLHCEMLMVGAGGYAVGIDSKQSPASGEQDSSDTGTNPAKVQNELRKGFFPTSFR